MHSRYKTSGEGTCSDTYKTRAQLTVVTLTSSISIYCLHADLQKVVTLSCHGDKHTKKDERVVLKGCIRQVWRSTQRGGGQAITLPQRRSECCIHF